MEKKGLQSTVRSIIVDGKPCARKYATEAGKEDLFDQVMLLLALPPSMQQHYPKLLDYNLTIPPYYYTMPYYTMPTLKDIILDTNIGSDLIIQKIQPVFNYLMRVQHTWRRQICPSDYLERVYFKRAYKRITDLAASVPILNVLEACSYLRINDEHLLSPLKCLDRIHTYTAALELLKPDYVCSTHGQVEFSHLLIDINTDEFVLLDHKGINDLLDPMYDIGKFRQCSHGLLDWVENGLFRIEDFLINREELIIPSLVFENDERQKICLRVNQWLEKLIQDNASTEASAHKTKCRALFAEGVHLCSSVPFCYGSGDIAKAIACYISSARTLNELIRSL